MDGDRVLIRIPGELTDEQREGRACVWCGSEDAPAMVALGMVGQDWLFMCAPQCQVDEDRQPAGTLMRPTVRI